MTFPLLINNDDGLDSLPTMLSWASAERGAIKAGLEQSGAILFRGFPIHSAEDFDAFTQVFGYEEFTYKESLSNAVRINLTRRVFTANEAPPEVEIFLHHEMAQTPMYPQKIFFCCLSAAEQGGATPLCRSDLLYAKFKSEHPQWAAMFVEHGLKYNTHMPAMDDELSGQGRSWRSTLSVANRTEAEARLSELGYTWSWQEDGSLMTTTPRLPAVRQLDDGSESFFNQVIAAYRGWKRRDDSSLPVLTFGNSEPIPEAVMDALVTLSAQFVYAAQWQDGDVALVDNYRVMHGRYPYSGNRKRQVVVCLAR
ncbi:MAG: TauD/TfdA family dioxygenase [Pseudomonadota bacterium]